MNAFALSFTIILAVALDLCSTTNCLADIARTAPLNFDTQLVRIFEAAQSAPATSPHDPSSGFIERDVLKRIVGKLRDHKMMLKNVVYRTDMGVIRITWADDANEDVVKVAYKTGKDPVLGNSLYADKRQVIDVKIMYRRDKDTYAYLRLQNMDNDKILTPSTPSVPQKPAFNYIIESQLTNEQCRFCHVLAKNDGSPVGVFFPRYQEVYKTPPLESGLLFRAEHFTRKSAADAEKLGLPKMEEDFLYQKLVMNTADGQDERARFFRAMIELPQLVEVMARDNRQSTCVIADFGDASQKFGFGRNDYVCADNKAERLYVRLTNARLTVNHGAKEYAEPYFVKY